MNDRAARPAEFRPLPPAAGPFARILVAYNGSDAADVALSTAITLAGPANGDVVAVNVSDFSAPSVVALQTAAFRSLPITPVIEALDPSRLDLYNKLRDRVAASPVPVTLEFSTNGIAAGILDAARRWKATAIAIGTRGLTGLALVWTGSVADEVLRRAAVPVIVVRDEPGPDLSFPRRAIVGVDGSEPSDAAARFAVAVAEERSARLVFCTVARERIGYLDETSDPTPLLSEVRAAARDALETGVQYATEAGVLANTELIDDGDPATVLMEVAEREQADMIVVGTHGRKYLERIALGSTAEQLVRRSRVPVVVVPLGARVTRSRQPLTQS